MAAIINGNIKLESTNVEFIDSIAECNGTLKPIAIPKYQLALQVYSNTFEILLGDSPTHSLLLSTEGTSNNPFFHEACVFLPKHDEIYITSNLLASTSSSAYPTILISRVKLHRDSDGAVNKVEWAKMRPPPGLEMPNGGVNYKDGILFCAQGTATSGTGGIYYMPRGTPPKPMVTNFHGRDFNSVNDVVVSKDGCIWFTDPCYGHEQDFRQKPKLPCQVYRYDPKTGGLRVVADGFGMCNGICFDPDETVCYITDTDQVHADGKVMKNPATVYAFDIITRAGAPFLTHRRVFAYAAVGIPDGIKCDMQGNVYSGCGDGVEVWNPAGSLIGKIIVPGGVANFCFGRDGEMFLCAEQNLWRLQVDTKTCGALLGKQSEW